MIRAFLAEGARIIGGAVEATFHGRAHDLRGPLLAQNTEATTRAQAEAPRDKRGRAQGLCAGIFERVARALLGSLGRAMPAWSLPILSGDVTGEQDLTGLILLILLLFGTFTAVLHLLGRRDWTRREKALTAELTQTHARLDRANLFLSTEPQIVIAWGAADSEPDVEGDYSLVTDAPLPRRVLGFASWLAPDLAQKMDQAVERLRERGEGFSVAVASTRGRHFEIEGRAVAGRAVMRIRDVSGDRLQLVRLRESHTELLDELGAIRTMLDAIPHPVWTRDGDARLAWSNAAYARAVEAKDSVEVSARSLELSTAIRARRLSPRAWTTASGANARPPSPPASARCTKSSTSPARTARPAWPATCPKRLRYAPNSNGR